MIVDLLLFSGLVPSLLSSQAGVAFNLYWLENGSLNEEKV